ncbi:MAG: Maf family protein [Neomegalonema sp.]|nr:Maf family protein [Neomegalonema sp.]
MLERAGISFVARPAHLDEERLIEQMVQEGAGFSEIAIALAQAKAAVIRRSDESAVIIGCDQLLVFEGQILSKVSSREEAAERLFSMQGKTHALVTGAAVLTPDGSCEALAVESLVSMRVLSSRWIENYLAEHYEEVRHSVTCYQIEGLGAQMIAHLSSDNFSVMGMPLLEIIGILRAKGLMEQ